MVFASPLPDTGRALGAASTAQRGPGRILHINGDRAGEAGAIAAIWPGRVRITLSVKVSSGDNVNGADLP